MLEIRSRKDDIFISMEKLTQPTTRATNNITNIKFNKTFIIT
jgi:hypothetical protein